MKNFITILMLLPLLLACNDNKDRQNMQLLEKKAFEKVYQGEQIELYTLSKGGIVMQVTNFGGRVVSLWVPDKNGNYEDVVLGHPSIDEYIEPKGERFLGPVVGRYANRIANGQFEIDGTNYQLPINNNGQTLHGGIHGLDMVVWSVVQANDSTIVLSYSSADGEEGFPGKLDIEMTYKLTADSEFSISYKAVTDKPTIVNLSHHGLFNLKGEGNGTILDHVLNIKGDYITPVDSVLIPTGEYEAVEGTPFDFRIPTAIGDRINQIDKQLRNGSGYDHNWVIHRDGKKGVMRVASIVEPESGRVMEVYSDQPGLQFYSGNFFDGQVKGKHGKPLNHREAFALETQHFPDSPNHYNFPSTRLNPDEVYSHICIYKFLIQQ